ncbi:MAG: hypothetical protein JJU22_00915 [Gammaproteobacteria bacterium]|nr:hypothetical protein [Gammaproteobacteria bacterium]
MPKMLPFRATTASGNTFDFEFPLHADTANPAQVSNLISALLQTLDREIQIQGEVGNGDLLQALAMTLAVRVRMLGARSASVDEMVEQLLGTALDARVEPAMGNQDPNVPRPLH